MSLAALATSDHPAASVEKKPRSRRATTPAVAAGDKSTGRKPGKLALGHKKVSFFLPRDLVRRLEIKAVAEDIDTSEALAKILQESEGLRRWRLQDLSPRGSDQATVEVSSD